MDAPALCHFAETMIGLWGEVVRSAWDNTEP